MIVEVDELRVVDTNNRILSAIKTLNAYEKELKSQIPTKGNIFGVFFHDLVVHFSCILIQREINNSDTSIPEFPFVSSEFARLPSMTLVSQTGLQDLNGSLKTKIWQTALLPFAVGNSIPFGYKQSFWQAKCLNLFGEYQKPTKAYLQNLELQLEVLSEAIQTICRNHGIVNANVLRKIWFNHIANHTTDSLKATKSKLIVVGNRQDLQNRKLAYNFLEQDKEVIAFTHGEIASTIFEEPMYRYAEWGLCTTLVEYGEKLSKVDNEDVLNPPTNILYRNSEVARSQYRRSDNIIAKKLEDSRVLYIPTIYVGNDIYGPYHAYPDRVYREWHSAIHRVVPSVIFKSHPKSKGHLQVPGPEERRWLDDCIDEYDLFILDYVATSTVLAMLTDKPVIFLDVGLRRLAAEFLNSLKERCHYVCVDINGDLDNQLEGAIFSYYSGHDRWSNLGLEEYCLSRHSTFHWKDIFRRAM